MKGSIPSWKAEIRSAKEAMRLLRIKLRELKSNPRYDRIAELNLICKIGDYKSLVWSRESAIKSAVA